MPDGDFGIGDELDAEALAEQLAAARQAAERQFRHYQEQIAAELSRNVAETFGETAAGPVAVQTLEDAPIADLHRLEQADGRLRHSIVEACFYNLRLYSDLLPDRREKPGFREKLQANLDHLPAIRDDLRDFFAMRVGEFRLADYFPAQEKAVFEDLGRITDLAKDLTARYDDEACLGRFVDGVPGEIDRVMAALAEITAALRGIKVDLVALLQEVVALHWDRLAAAGIAVRFTNENGEAAPIFARRRDLMSALGELIKNAARHGLVDLPPGRPKMIGIVLRLVTVGQQTYQIDVADSGCGIPETVRQHLGVRGVTTGGTGEGLAMVRHIIEDGHLGSLAILSRQGTGTLIRIHLPRTLVRSV